ncbi:MAG: SAF domain-containing protein [Erysipelotrichaceae bacterium]|nr:SAF domain-containing protein [Erysipelotrichaceae bacterium]
MKKRKKFFLIPIFVLLIFAILYFGSELLAIYRLGLTKVVVAKMSLPQRTMIKEDLLEYIYVPKEYVKDNAYLSKEEVLDKYVKLNSYIPKGSLIYKDFVEDKSNMKDGLHLDLKKDEVTYDLFIKDIKVNPAHLLTGMNVDLYLTINKKEIVSDLLISGARITGLYDINNKEIKANNDNYTLGTISIAIKKDMVPILNKAITIGEVSLIVGSDLYNNGSASLNSSSKIFDLLS